MSQEPYAGESSDTPWTLPLESELAEPVVPPKPALDTAPLSTLALTAAGLASLNVLLTLACSVAWLMDEQMGLTVIQASNGLWVLFGLAAIGLGAYIQRQQKLALVKGGITGTIANATILSGTFIMSGAILLPMISAMRSIIGSAG